MIIKDMTGYMLSGNGILKSGEQWWPHDTNVYVCLSLEKAQELLALSHDASLKHGTIWTTIYRVNAKNIDCNKIGNGLVWTNQPTKIIVDCPVYYRAPRMVSEGKLLQNAKRILPRYSRLMNQLYSQENVK